MLIDLLIDSLMVYLINTWTWMRFYGYCAVCLGHKYFLAQVWIEFLRSSMASLSDLSMIACVSLPIQHRQYFMTHMSILSYGNVSGEARS